MGMYTHTHTLTGGKTERAGRESGTERKPEREREVKRDSERERKGEAECATNSASEGEK